MNEIEILPHLLDCLNEAEISYVIVGSFATNVYAIMRSTQDADIVIDAQPGQLTKLIEALGKDYQRDPQSRFETVTGTSKTVVTERTTGFIIEIFGLSDDPHDQARFARRRMIEIQGRSTWILTAEDVLVTKLNWLLRANRQKDLQDIRNVIAVQGDAINWPYVERWCDQHGSLELLNKIRADLHESLKRLGQ